MGSDVGRGEVTYNSYKICWVIVMALSGLSDSEIARRGQELYERSIRPIVESRHGGEYVAVDVETGAYEIDAQDVAAIQRAKAKRPEAPLYIVRVGHAAAYRLGGKSLPSAS